MSRKKNQEKTLSFIGKSIATTAIINQLTIGCHQDKISLTNLSLAGHDKEIV